MDKVDIVMSVFNGERFLQEMLDSLSSQTYEQWRLIVRNNGSTDRTAEILRDFSMRFPATIVVDAQNNEPCIPLSFSGALAYSTAPYVMYADADDVWLPNKVEAALSAITSLEAQHGTSIPILVHSDLILVDEKLKTISASMWRAQALDPKRNKLNQVIMHSNACGNTFIFNRALYDKVYPVPPGCIMHDYWTTCVAAAFGVIGALPQTYILYRQHGQNACGGARLGYDAILNKLLNLGSLRGRLNDKYSFAALFLSRFGDDLCSDHVSMLKALARFGEMSWTQRRAMILRYSLYQNSLLRNVGLLLFC